jgi:hypothetical protein
MRKKPQRVIQLKKSGNTRQAVKTYKVTNEGLVYVQACSAARRPDVGLTPADAFSVLPVALRQDLLSAYQSDCGKLQGAQGEPSELTAGSCAKPCTPSVRAA